MSSSPSNIVFFSKIFRIFLIFIPLFQFRPNELISQGFETKNLRTFGNETRQRGVVNAHVFQIWDQYVDGNVKIVPYIFHATIDPKQDFANRPNFNTFDPNSGPKSHVVPVTITNGPLGRHRIFAPSVFHVSPLSKQKITGSRQPEFSQG